MNPRKRLTRRESQEETRTRLILAAEKIFIQCGFEGASVERIAEAAGFSRGAFYSNFDDKDALFLAVLNKRRLDTAVALDTILKQNPDTAGRLRAARDWYIEQCHQKEWTTLKTEFQLRALRNRTVKTRLADLLNQELETYAALMARYFSEANVESAHRPEVIALSLLAVGEGIGRLSLLGLEGFTEVCNLAFERLIPIPEAPRKIKHA